MNVLNLLKKKKSTPVKRNNCSAHCQKKYIYNLRLIQCLKIYFIKQKFQYKSPYIGLLKRAIVYKAVSNSIPIIKT